MLRTGRLFFTTLVLACLSVPAAARAAQPAGSLTPPDAPLPDNADPSALPTSFSQSIPIAGATTITEVQSPGLPPLPFGGQTIGQYRPRFWQPFVGAETVFLAPVHNTGGGGANYTFNDGATSSYSASSANGMIVSPRLWMGLMNERWGVGIRYWSFANAPGGGQFPPGTSQGVYSQGALRLETFDLEAIRRFQFDHHQLWFTVGVRQAQFGRDASVSSSDYFDHGVYSASASSASRFSGVGVTASLYGTSQIGDSNWNLFYGGRASYLSIGSSSAFALATAAYNSNAGGAAWVDPEGNIGNGDAFIGEMQLGVQYNRALEMLPATVFFRLALEYQYWHVNNGSSASANANASSNSGNVVSATAAAGNSDLGLLGFGLATGFTW